FLDKTFGQVLNDDNSPVALLKLVKDFAKQALQSDEDVQLQSVGAALYYAAYAAGIVRCRQRLGGLLDDELKKGFEWALSRDWLDESPRKLILQASQSLATEA